MKITKALQVLITGKGEIGYLLHLAFLTVGGGTLIFQTDLNFYSYIATVMLLIPAIGVTIDMLTGFEDDNKKPEPVMIEE